MNFEKPGDCFVIERRENNYRFPVIVASIARDGSPRIRWEKQCGGDAVLTKPILWRENVYKLVGPATAEQETRLRVMLAREKKS